MKKLSKGAIWGIIGKLRRGFSVYQSAREATVSERWVRHIWKIYLTTGGIPESKPCGRKPRRLEASQKKALVEIIKKHPLGAVSLETILRYEGVNISHNKIHGFMKEKGLISSDEKKVYSLTKKGQKEVVSSCNLFCRMFYDVKEMFHCCPLHRRK